MKYKFNTPLRNPYTQYTYTEEEISNSDISFLAATTKIAATSNYRFRTAALVVKSGRVLGGDTNIRKIGPETPPQRVTTHAEVRTLKPLKNTAGATIYIARLKADDTTGIAKPCVWCLQHIINAQITKIVYTTNTHGTAFKTDMITWNKKEQP